MRAPRSWQTQDANGRFFHCISRVVDQQFVLGKEEKDHFVQIMRKVEAFSGIKVLTFCVMDNHFHVLLEVPDRQELSDQEFLKRIRLFYSGKTSGITRRDIEWKMENWREKGWDDAVDELKERYISRMYNLSEFMKTLKQRFTQWFNGKHHRKGTLWESRFKSVLVGGSWEAILSVAAYIDLNPIRARMVADPEDYRWCGYGQALAGKKIARRGLGAILETEGQSSHWTHVSHEYRKLLYGVGEKETRSKQTRKIIGHGLDQDTIQNVLDSGGTLTQAQLLRCRARYFCDGFVIGTKEFVNDFFQHNSNRFGSQRQDGARKIRGANCPNICTLRDLRIDRITCERKSSGIDN
ncbi:MAG: transposase [Verrucomicrobiota bacterium]